jgi:hypothetical protein
MSQIPIADEGKPEARLGDLDFKSPHNGKGVYWRSLEEQLLEQDWYRARKTTQIELDYSCLLAHGM